MSLISVRRHRSHHVSFDRDRTNTISLVHYEGVLYEFAVIVLIISFDR